MTRHYQNTNCRAFLIDASIYIFRGWHVYPETIVDQQHQPINAVYGFLYFLSDFLSQVNPEHIVIAFDGSAKTGYRRQIYPEYKANREPTPPTLKPQFALCKQIAEQLGFCCLQSDVYEADDLIATMANRYKQLDFGTTILSADKDLAQIMSDEDDFLWDFSRNEVYDAKRVEEKFGVLPDKIAQLLALAGDKVDNIPGVSGVGVKTAAKILKRFASIEQLLANPDQFKQCKFRNAAQIGEQIYANADLIRLYHQLTILSSDAQIDGAVDGQWCMPSAQEIDSVLMGYNVDNILRSRFTRMARDG